MPFLLNAFDGYHWDIHLAMYYRLTNAQVSAITSVRVYINNDDIYYYLKSDNSLTSTVQLSERFLSTLSVLAHLRGLSKITIEWIRQLWDDNWEGSRAILEGQLSERVGHDLKQMGRGAEIEVAVLLSERKLVNTESEMMPNAATYGIVWGFSRPGGSAHQHGWVRRRS
jgi:hypothetical protein